MKNYIVATIKPWNIKEYKNYAKNSARWHLITEKKQLTVKKIKKIKPRYIFFPHWSWTIPDEIINNFECVCFHSSNVPYGRGGSPIQNLIIRGHQKTKISALRMVKELDAGPVYLKKTLSLTGNAQSIFENMAKIIGKMIREIIATEPTPTPQKGKVVKFKRRQTWENILPVEGTLRHLYNHIRMLDAESYPRSHINHGNFKIEFTNALLKTNLLEAKIRIIKKI